jgi:hypothetical protein
MSYLKDKNMRNAKQMQDLQNRLNNLTQAQKHVDGDIIYTFENHRKHDLSLPRKSFDNKGLIPPRGKFKGDAYFLMLLKTGDVRLVSSEPYISESKKETDMQKLILEQPNKVTIQGTTESVVVEVPVQQKLNETPQKVNQLAPDVLLVENPLDGIDIIKG